MNRVDKAHQLRLMTGALKDYQEDLMSLGMLIQKIEGLLEIIQDRSFKDSVFNSFLALEEVYARTRIGEFDFAKDGKFVVDRAVQEILSKAETYPVRLN